MAAIAMYESTSVRFAITSSGKKGQHESRLLTVISRYSQFLTTELRGIIPSYGKDGRLVNDGSGPVRSSSSSTEELIAKSASILASHVRLYIAQDLEAATTAVRLASSRTFATATTKKAHAAVMDFLEIREKRLKEGY